MYYIHAVGGLQPVCAKIKLPQGYVGEDAPQAYTTRVLTNHRPKGVIETHLSLGAALHAIEVLDAHNVRNGHPERYAYTEGSI